MQNRTVNERIIGYRKKHMLNQCFMSVLLVLSLVVSACVFWQLRLTGISQTGEAYCGYEEHQHSENCIEKHLICTITGNAEQHNEEEGSEKEKEIICTMPEHIHGMDGENCFEERSELICSEEHEHSDECWETHSELICTKQEHIHSEECYAQDTAEPTEVPSEHIHTEECYEALYSCGFKAEYEHIHSLQCYSNPEADIETPETWKTSVSAAKLGGNWAEDLVSVAKTQLGYRESRSNYLVQDDGISYKGYTRYGAWYEEPYGEWDAMFVSFCLRYAKIPAAAVCSSSDTAAWPVALMRQGAYAKASEHEACIGDIIFLALEGNGRADAVGVISNVTEDSFKAIVGGKENVVSVRNYSLDDKRIVGYVPVLELYAQSEESFDMSMSLFAAGTETNIYSYVVGGNRGSITIQLLDKYDNLHSGTEVSEGEDYKLVYSVSCTGFAPGTYYYQLPVGTVFTDNSMVSHPITGSGGAVFGHWSVDSDNNRLVFTFDENANGMQNVQITASSALQFVLRETPIEFEGGVEVTVKPKEGHTPPSASLKKSGVPDNKDGIDRIAWTIDIQGAQDYPLAGLELTDTLLGEGYASSGNQLWLEFRPPTGGYYSYGVYLSSGIFTENGWTYTIPASFTCEGCNDASFNQGGHIAHTVNVGNDWYCAIYYSTPITGEASIFRNEISGGGKTDTAIVLPSSGAGIIKSGRMEDSVFKWSFDINIPAGSYYRWFIWDITKVKGPNDLSTTKTCDFGSASVQAYYEGEWHDIPKLSEATADDRFTWRAEPYSSGDCGLYLLNRCTCSATNHCTDWSESKRRCDNRLKGMDGTYFCHCWHQESSIAIKVDYETPGSLDIISNYGGEGRCLSNYAEMSAKTAKENGQKVSGGDTMATVRIPGVFSKKLLAAADSRNNYTAQFNITVNEEMKDLSLASIDGIVTIVDMMSQTLFYENGSMVIIKTDPSGIEAVMKVGEDYTVAASDDFHRITIQLLDPGMYMYELKYNAALDIIGKGGALIYDNSASVTLFGNTYKAEIDTETLSDYSSTAENFRFTITKVSELNPEEKLGGACFGLYNESDVLIASGETAPNGTLVFETNITQGIIFHTNAAYYLQEIEPPPGYQPDSTKHWFYFAKKPNQALEAEYTGIARFPYQNQMYMGAKTIENSPAAPILPNTGGIGTFTYAIGGLLLIAAPLVNRYISRHKYRERRNQPNLRSG